MVNLDMDLTWSIILKIALLSLLTTRNLVPLQYLFFCRRNHCKHGMWIKSHRWGFGGYGRLVLFILSTVSNLFLPSRYILILLYHIK
ncbi:hypothetical protein Hanom_Chr14g01327891 [Helianthus anomalus]